MHSQFLKFLFILALLDLSPALASVETATATAHITFKGTSTLHDFEGAVATQPFIATLFEDPATGQLRLSASAIVNVLDMSTEHGKRNKNMFKMLDQKNFNLISGSLTNAPLASEGSSTVSLHLKIRDVEQSVIASLSDWQRDGNQVSGHMAFDISLKAFGLKPPSVLGVIRVGDTVSVECELQGTQL